MTGAQAKTTHSKQLYIGGKWLPQKGNRSIDVLSASTEEVIGAVPEGTPEDVHIAVQAARQAFDSGWGQTTVQERAGWLGKLANALKERGGEIASTISGEIVPDSCRTGLVRASRISNTATPCVLGP